jgi:hypothetical protein
MEFMKPVSLRVLIVCGITLATIGVLGIKHWTVAAAPEKGKYLPFRLATLGQTHDEVIRDSGQPKESIILPSGIESMRFQDDSIRQLVEISPKTKKVIQIYVFKKRPFTDTEIQGLLKDNSEGHQWKPKADIYAYRRTDGGLSRGGPMADGEFMFAIISGSELK